MFDQARNLFISRITSRLENYLTPKEVFDVVEVIREAIDSYQLVINRIELKTTDDYLETFLSSKRDSGMRSSTERNYRRRIEFLQKFANCTIPEITEENIQAYFEDEENRGVKESTRNAEYRIFCSFFGWLKDHEYLHTNPIEKWHMK